MKNIFATLLALNALAIIALWWLGSSSLLLSKDPETTLIALGRISGLFLEYAFLLQLVLVGRIVWIERVFGFDQLNRLHRWVGYSLGIFLIAHPLLLVIGYAQGNQLGKIEQFLSFIQHWEDIWKAALAVALIIGIITVSLPWIRKHLRYETWHGIHLLMYVAIALAFEHQLNTGDVAAGYALGYWLTLNAIVFGLVLVYRFLRPFLLYFRHRFVIEQVIKESASVTSIVISGRDLSRFSFEAGQYANLLFLTPGLWSSHPFSFSAAPNGKTFRFTMKRLGDFTSRVTELKPGTHVLIDGPFGRFTERASHRDAYLLIAGGIGITPIRALAESLQQKGKNVVVLYSAKRVEDLTFKQELEFVSPNIRYLLSDPSSPLPDRAEHGMLNADKIQQLVPDATQREAYICGPEPMMLAMVESLKTLGLPRAQIHYERFSH